MNEVCTYEKIYFKIAGAIYTLANLKIKWHVDRLLNRQFKVQQEIW